MSRTCVRVQPRQSRPTPRGVVTSDQPAGSPCPPASSGSVAPQRSHVATGCTVPPRAACQADGPMTDDVVQQLLEASGATANRDVLRDILRTAAGLAGDGADRLDLKITAA